MSALAWGGAGLTLAGQTRSGDRGFVVPYAGGALVAVIDGLGHGNEACAAAVEAERVITAAPQTPIDELIRACHESLRKTRGVVISLASFDVATNTMTWLGVGNVEGFLVRAEDGAIAPAVALRGGTVGYLLPPLRAQTLPVHPGDTLVLATDGIRHGFKQEVRPDRAPQEIADRIITNWGKPTDDAYVIVARYVGDSDATKIEIDGDADVAHARIRSRDAAQGLGFDHAGSEAIAIAVSELARNIVVHAVHGEIVLSRAHARGRRGLVVVARDRGPGIPNIALAMQDGFTTAGGMGCGLPGAQRLVDKLEIASEPGVGTVVRIEKWLP